MELMNGACCCKAAPPSVLDERNAAVSRRSMRAAAEKRDIISDADEFYLTHLEHCTRKNLFFNSLDFTGPRVEQTVSIHGIRPFHTLDPHRRGGGGGQQRRRYHRCPRSTAPPKRRDVKRFIRSFCARRCLLIDNCVARCTRATTFDRNQADQDAGPRPYVSSRRAPARQEKAARAAGEQSGERRRRG